MNPQSNSPCSKPSSIVFCSSKHANSSSTLGWAFVNSSTMPGSQRIAVDANAATRTVPLSKCLTSPKRA